MGCDVCLLVVIVAVVASASATEFGPREGHFPTYFVKAVTPLNFNRTFGELAKPLFLVEFMAPWCPHCRHSAPHVERLAQTFNTDPRSPITVAAVDCVADSALCDMFNVVGYPTFKFGLKESFAHYYTSQRAGKPLTPELQAQKDEEDEQKGLQSLKFGGNVMTTTTVRGAAANSTNGTIQSLKWGQSTVTVKRNNVTGKATPPPPPLPQQQQQQQQPKQPPPHAPPKLIRGKAKMGDGGASVGIQTLNVSHTAEAIAKWVGDFVEKQKKLAANWWQDVYAPKSQKRPQLTPDVVQAAHVFSNAPYNTYIVHLTPPDAFDASFKKRLASQKRVRIAQHPHRVNMWDVETGAAMALHHVFDSSGGPDSPDSIFNRTSPAAKKKMSALTDFVSLMCSSYPNVTCKQSWCQLIVKLGDYVRDGGKEMAAKGDPVDASGLTYLERHWKLCGREWTAYEKGWMQCRGSYPYMRGYTCSLWLFMHSTVGQIEHRFKENLQVLRTFIGQFFGCVECREHFLALTSDLEHAHIESRRDAVLYLWRKHNLINMRVMRLEYRNRDGDPAFPKHLWPSIPACPRCRRRGHPQPGPAPPPLPANSLMPTPTPAYTGGVSLNMTIVARELASPKLTEAQMEQFFLGDEVWDEDAVSHYVKRFYSPPKPKEVFWV